VDTPFRPRVTTNRWHPGAIRSERSGRSNTAQPTLGVATARSTPFTNAGESSVDSAETS
jgi:hypothetical protein